MNYKEACLLLSVSTNATLKEIAEAYSLKIKFYNPDDFKDDPEKRAYAEEMNKKLDAAWVYIQEHYEEEMTHRESTKANAKDPKKQKNRNKKGSFAPWIALIVTVALIAALVVVAVVLNNRPDDKPVATTPSVSTKVPAPDYDFMGSDLSALITLGQYKGYTIEVEAKEELTDELLWQQINRELINAKQFVEVKDRKVLESDIVKIKYVGYTADGKKFEGGEGTAETFTIYNGGGFIDGFAKGIIGADVGVEFDVNVTFPEDYHAEDLAGQPATFKVTVEFIYEAKELTDTLVSEMSNGTYKTAEAFIVDFRNAFQEQIDLEYKTAKLTATWLKILDAAKEVNIPEEEVNEYYNYAIAYYQDYATYYGMTLDTFLQYMGLTKEDIKKQAYDEFFYELVLHSIIKAENISVSEAEFNEMLKEMMDDNGVDEATIYQYYSKEDLDEMFLATKAYESVLEWNTYVDKAPEDSSANDSTNG